MNTDFDAVIIGAGPAGTAAAIGLARQGRRVAIIERSEFPRRKVCGEFTSAINIDLLDTLGVGQAFRQQAGPEVRRVALFAAGSAIEAPMPAAPGHAFGQALGRDVLDGLLLAAAGGAGVSIFQPWRAVAIMPAAEGTVVRMTSGSAQMELRAPVIIAAHGSWEQGKLPTHLAKINRPHDFLGFKAHFRGASLARDLMPLIAFPGGYGGMVWADQDRLSLSFCIQRATLDRARKAGFAGRAAEAAFAHVLRASPCVDETLRNAGLAGEWLAAGPIRPGIRAGYADDVFRVGNVAGESHPIIAEGIGMALQSGWLLADHLGQFEHWDSASRAAAGKAYSRAWRRQFATRVGLASVLSALAGSPRSAALMSAVARRFPASLSLGAGLSGKTKPLPPALTPCL